MTLKDVIQLLGIYEDERGDLFPANEVPAMQFKPQDDVVYTAPSGRRYQGYVVAVDPSDCMAYIAMYVPELDDFLPGWRPFDSLTLGKFQMQ